MLLCASLEPWLLIKYCCELAPLTLGSISVVGDPYLLYFFSHSSVYVTIESHCTFAMLSAISLPNIPMWSETHSKLSNNKFSLR